MDDLLKWRVEFPILEKSTYLISNSLGAMPRRVFEQMQSYAEAWATRGVRAWEESWWGLAGEVGDRVGRLIGAEPGDVTVHQNVTLTQAVIASCFDFSGPRNKVVMVDLEFPSIQYFYHEQRARGAGIEVVKCDGGFHVPLERLLAAIDERTLLVPISLVLFRSATILDARAIVERAHRVGARVILDIFQAAGTVPVNVRELGVDFAVGGVLKWLCGGPGVAYLYARSDLRAKLKPSLTGWFAHKRPFAFEPGPIDRTEGAFRFLTGTTQVPALYACLPGLEILEEVGIERVRRKSMRQTQRLMDLAREHGWRVNTPADAAERGGTVSVECPHAAEVTRELLQRDVLVDYRPGAAPTGRGAGIRLSPHFYTRDDEIDFAVQQISEILATSAWERHLQPA
jgi:kynureninase